MKSKVWQGIGMAIIGAGLAGGTYVGIFKLIAELTPEIKSEKKTSKPIDIKPLYVLELENDKHNLEIKNSLLQDEKNNLQQKIGIHIRKAAEMERDYEESLNTGLHYAQLIKRKIERDNQNKIKKLEEAREEEKQTLTSRNNELLKNNQELTQKLKEATAQIEENASLQDSYNAAQKSLVQLVNKNTNLTNQLNKLKEDNVTAIAKINSLEELQNNYQKKNEELTQASDLITRQTKALECLYNRPKYYMNWTGQSAGASVNVTSALGRDVANIRDFIEGVEKACKLINKK